MKFYNQRQKQGSNINKIDIYTLAIFGLKVNKALWALLFSGVFILVFLQYSYAQVISKSNWSLVSVDSQELVGENGAGVRAIDGNSTTRWHTKWLNGADPLPHEIQINLGAVYDVSGFRYLQNQINGRIAQWEFYVGTSTANWGTPVATGTFANTATEKEVLFTQKAGQYVRLRALSEVNGNPWTHAAEINVLGVISGNQPPDGVIDTPTGNVTINVGGTVNFTGTGTDPNNNLPLTYLWNFGGAGISNSTLEDPGLLQFNAPGTFTVSFTVADALGLADPTPATRVITVQSGASVIPHTNWSLVSVDSQELVGENGAGVRAIDGNSTTRWHTKWLNGADPLPHEIQINLGAVYDVNGFRYLPNQINGRIAQWEFYVSTSTANWGTPVATGTFANTAAEKEVLFTQKAGQYVRLRALSEVNGNPWTHAAEINVLGILSGNQAPNGVIDTPATDVTIGVGGEVNFTGAAIDPDNNLPLTYLWEFGAGSGVNDSLNEDPGTTTFNIAGTYTVSFTVTDALGLSDPSPGTRTVSVQAANQSPNGVIDTPATDVTIGVGGEVNFTGAAIDPDNNLPLTYLWEFGAGSGVNDSLDEDPGTTTFNIAGTYTVSFTVTDALGLSDPSPGTRTVSVQAANQSPNGVIDTPATDVTIGVGGEVNFTGAAIDPDNNLPLTYLWEFGAGSGVNDSLDEDPGTTTFNIAGTYTVSFTVTDALGLSDPSPGTRTVSVQVANQAPNGVIDTPVGDVVIGVGGEVNFTGAAIDPDNNLPLTYLWEFGAGSGVNDSLDEDPGTTTFNIAGTYTVSFTVTDALGLSDPSPGTRTVSVQVANQSPNGVIDTPATDVTIGVGGEVNFTGAAIDPDNNLPLTYLWEFGAGSGVNDSLDEDPGTTTFNIAGTYTVSFTVTDALGLSDPSPGTRTVSVQVANQSPNGVIDTPATDVTIGVGGEVNFTGAAVDPDNNLPLTYLWEFGAGSGVNDSLNEDPGTTTFNIAGTYTVSFTVTDALGLADPSPGTRTVSVQTANQAPNGVIDTPATDVTIGVGGEVNFTGAAIDPDNNLPLTYLWEFGAGSGVNDSLDEDPGTTTFNIPGTYTVSFTVTDALGLADPSPGTRTVSVQAANQSPNGVIDTPATDVTIGVGGEVNFTGAAIDPDNNLPLTYLWEFGAGSGVNDSLDEDPGTTTFNIAGTYTVSFTVTDALGLSDPSPGTRTVSVQVANQAPNGVIDTPVGDVVIGVGGEVNFTGAAIDPDNNLPLTYLWEFGAGSGVNDSLDEDPGTTTFNIAGTYTVSFTVTDALGLSDPSPGTRTVSVQVANQSPNGVIDTPATDVTIGVGGEVNFTGAAIDPDNNLPLTYLWEFGAGSGVNDSLDEDPGTTTFNIAGTYTVSFTVTDALGLSDPSPGTRTVSVQVANQAPNGVIDTPVGDVVIGVGGEVNFTGAAVDPDNNLPLTYLWEFGAGSGVNDSLNEDPGTTTFNIPGTYTVSFTVTDALGLSDPSPGTRTVMVQAPVISKTNWSLVFVDSQELVGENGAGVRAIDGNSTTRWHTKWLNGADPLPHEIQINLGSVYNVGGFRYLPSQVNGRIAQWEFYVGTSTSNWGTPVATGTFANDATEKEVLFTQKAGQYVRLRALSEVNGNPWTHAAEINVLGVISGNQPPNGVIDTPTGNVTISVGGTVNFTGTGTDPNIPLTFLWNFGGSGIANSTAEDPGLKQFNTAGTYTVSFTVTDALGLADPTPATRVITVQSGASVIPHTNWSLVSVDSQELAGENGAGVNAFDGNVATRWHTKWLNGADPLPHEIQINLGGVYDVNGFRYLPNQINGRIAQWEFYVSTSTANWGTPVATGTFANDATEKEVLFTQKAGQYVRLRALSEVNGNPWTHAAEINILGVVSGNQPPNGVIDTPTGNVTIGVGGTVNFTGTGTDPNTPLTFLWTFGGSGIANSTVEDPGLKQFNTVGTFTVSFTVTDALGLADPTPATRIVTVQSANQPPDGVIDTPTGNVTIGVGGTVNFTGTGTDPNTPLTFLWTFGGSGIANSTVEDPGLKQFNTAGTFTVSFTVTDALGLADPTPATRIVTVQSANQPPNGVIDTPTGNLTIDVGESVNFTGTGTDPNTPLTFLWTFGGAGIANSTVEDPGLKQFNTVGTFTVSFTVTDALGLADPTPATRIIAVQSGVLPNWKGATYSPFNLVTPTVVTNPVLKASDIAGVSTRFVADTFLYYESNTWYMFVEILNNSTNQGDLAVATSTDGLHWTYQQIVLNETFHLSYPYVFKFNGTYYMIPETYQLNEIRVYKATNFPSTWSYVATLVSGRDFVDPSIFRYNNTWWMFVSDTTNSNCYLYYSNSLTSGWIQHPLSPIVVGNAGKARPGGRAFVYNNNLIMRTVQKCDVVYGEKVRVFQVDTLTTTQYAEHEIPESPILSNSGSGWNATGMHQFDPWWTGNHWNCGVDGKIGTVSVWSAGIYLSPHPSSPNGVIDSPATNVTINKGQSVNFAGTGSDVGGNTPLTFLWNFGGAGVANSSLEDPGLKQFNTSGTFTVSFTATDTLGIYDPTPGVRTISVQSTSTVIPKTNWSLRFVDSQELVGENGAAVNGFDGNTSTKWHTKWFNGSDPLPHEIQINLGAVYNVSGFRYLPRQDGGVNGRIKDWEFYVSTDGTNWGSAVATGTFVSDATEKEVFFTLKAGQYVRLKALSEVNNNPWTSMAEITVLQN